MTEEVFMACGLIALSDSGEPGGFKGRKPAFRA
jgi:hypothetical protein